MSFFFFFYNDLCILNQFALILLMCIFEFVSNNFSVGWSAEKDWIVGASVICGKLTLCFDHSAEESLSIPKEMKYT